MIVCISAHVQWRWALNDFNAGANVAGELRSLPDDLGSDLVGEDLWRRASACRLGAGIGPPATANGDTQISLSWVKKPKLLVEVTRAGK